MFSASIGLVLVLLAACIAVSESGKIKYVIVLMMENRSFDHLLGSMKKTNPEINGCLSEDPACSNKLDPTSEVSVSVAVNENSVFSTNPDPNHSIEATTEQIYGGADDSVPPSMSGFIVNYGKRGSSTPSRIMSGFSDEHVPTIRTLAREFALFDGYFSSVPGPTEPNRAYTISCTSHGMGTNDAVTMVKGMPQKTLFRQILEMGLDYRIYFEQVPACLMFKDLRHQDARGRYKHFSDFKADLMNGTMPAYTWIEPAYFDTPMGPARDQHPDHDVAAGEALIKEVYEAVRASPLWNETALIITYDEHGGFFDHVKPPINVPPPDEFPAADSGNFTFNRGGVRVPFIIASPWVKKGRVVHAAPYDNSEGQYEHASIAATVAHKLFQPVSPFRKPEYLTKRDAWAKTFEWIFDEMESPRDDCITELPHCPSHRELFPESLPPLDGRLPLTDMQKGLIQMLAGAVGEDVPADLNTWTESRGAEFCDSRMKIFMKPE